MQLIRNYYSPTPAKWRKIGDTLLAVSSTVTGYSVYNQMKSIAITALCLGVVGKFLSNFFTENEPKENIKLNGKT